MNENSIGSRIALLRKKAGLTQNELADKLLISNKAVSKWESDAGNPSLELIIKLAEVFGCSLDYLVLGLTNDTKYKKYVDEVSLYIGKDINEQPFNKTLNQIVHSLIVGQTGSGKSNLLHGIINQIVTEYNPDAVKLALIDCKRVEFDLYNNLPHLHSPISKTYQDAFILLNKLVKELERRFDLFVANEVTNIKYFNKLNKQEKLPFILVIIDEVAELLYHKNKSCLNSIIRLLQLGRAVGIHLFIATQRPTIESLINSISNNTPTRVLFKLDDINLQNIILKTPKSKKDLNVGQCLFKMTSMNEPLLLSCEYHSLNSIKKMLIDNKIERAENFNKITMEEIVKSGVEIHINSEDTD